MAGAPLRLSIDHPTAGIRSFALASDDDPTIDLGGITNEPAYTSEGGQIRVQSVKGWKIEGVDVIIDSESGDQEYLQEVNDSLSPSNITYEALDGTIYTGSGSIEGEIKGSLKTQKVSLTLSGGGKLKKI